MSSINKSTLYTGVTSDLIKRVWQHKNNVYDGFSSRYNCIVLVYYCQLSNIEYAITEEERIKAGSRKQKEKMINDFNPEWKNLWDSINK